MNIRLIDVPLDLGANLRGVDMGPSALRRAGLKSALESLGHRVDEERHLIRSPIGEHLDLGNEQLRFLNPIVDVCSDLAVKVETSLCEGYFPLVLGGDHSIAVGTLAGVGAYAKKKNLRPGVVWIDAHGDFNTPETSPSGNIHGMSLAASVGLGSQELTALHGEFRKIDPECVVIIGLRDVDSGERENLAAAKIKTFTMADVDRYGMAKIVDEALAYLSDRCDTIHVSFDVDSLDPIEAPGVGTPVPGGLSYREVHLLMETLCAGGLVTSAEVVEVNPILDVRNQTAEKAVKMLGSLLGATIL